MVEWAMRAALSYFRAVVRGVHTHPLVLLALLGPHHGPRYFFLHMDRDKE